MHQRVKRNSCFSVDGEDIRGQEGGWYLRSSEIKLDFFQAILATA